MRESRPKRSGVGATRVKLVQTGGGPCKKSEEHKQTNDFLDIELGVSAEPMISQGQKQRMVMYFSPNLQHSLRLQSARYIAHLLPNFAGTRVKSKTTDGKLRSKFTVFARVFELRLLPPLL